MRKALVHAPADRERSERTIMITEIGDVITEIGQHDHLDPV